MSNVEIVQNKCAIGKNQNKMNFQIKQKVEIINGTKQEIAGTVLFIAFFTQAPKV